MKLSRVFGKSWWNTLITYVVLYYILPTFISAIVLLVSGSVLWYRNFTKYQLLENIPTSRLRSMAMGNLVEVSARAVDGPQVRAPNGENCIYYNYELQKYVKTKHGGYWSTFGTGESDDAFTITDGENDVVVRPKGADLRLKIDKTWRLDKADVPPNIREILEEHDKEDWGKEEKFLFIEYRKGGKLRMRQRSVAPGERLHIIGRAESARIGGEDVPVLVKDKQNDVFIISDSKERVLTDSLRKTSYIHLLAAIVGLGIITLALA